MTSLPVDTIKEWARLALRQYALREPTLSFLGHSDNITFRVNDVDEAVYLLRLHSPALAYWSGIRQLPEVIGSELAWMEALSSEGDFILQRPIHTIEGRLVASVQVQDDGEPIPATLLSWLPGEHFSPASADAPELVKHFGRLVGQLHDFSTRWSPPPGFIRPQYDLEHFRRIFARMLRGVDLGVFSEEIFWTLRAASQAVLEEIDRLPGDTGHWGMIHADLHVGNFLVSGSDLIPIDFSFCGFGHYLFDLSVCLAGGLNAALRPVFLEGYRSVRELPESRLRAVDAYALAGTMSYYAYQIDNPAEQAWLQRRIPEVARTICSRFLQGETVFWNM